MDATSPGPSQDSPASLPLARRLALLEAGSPQADALRDTLAAIQAHAARGRRGLAICAPAVGAGVSFVAASLALAAGRAGIRTLLIDANLRWPTLAELVPSPTSRDAGLLQFLRHEVEDPAQIIAADVAEGVSVIYGDGATDDVENLFDTDRFESVMRYALRTYDLTLIDTPPANRCAETRRIAAVAGYAAIVARRDVTMADDLKTLIADLRLDRTEVIGSIFNEG